MNTATTAAVVASLCLAGLSTHVVAAPAPAWTFDDSITIPTLLHPEDPTDDTTIKLPGNIYVPKDIAEGEKRPAIIFVNSWALNEYEYQGQAKAFADEGYIVLSYTTRGFWGAPGLINTAGDRDINDATTAIHWLGEHYPVDTSHIGMSGISYGAGISLLTALRSGEVAAVAALSGWGDLVESLWAGQTPLEIWVQVLIGSSTWPIGQRDPEVDQNLDNMRQHKNVAETLAWGGERSPITYVDQSKNWPRKPALYVSNNLHDYLFQPDSLVRLMSRYTGPWHVDFNPGVHATYESGGAIQSVTNNHSWDTAHDWFARYLKEEANGIENTKRISTHVESSAVAERESFDGFPVTDKHLDLFARPVADSNVGTLGNAPNDVSAELTVDAAYDKVWTGGVTGALQEESLFFIPEEIDPRGAIVFTSPVLEQGLFLRGQSLLTFSAKVSDKTQFFGYLLDLDPATNQAHWVGHGPLTWHRPDGSSSDPSGPQALQLQMYWTAHDFQPGHRAVLVVDTLEPEYYRYPDSPRTATFVIDAAHPMTVSIPYIEHKAEYSRLPSERTGNGSGGTTGSGAEAPVDQAAHDSYKPTGGGLDAMMVMLMGAGFSVRRRMTRRMLH